MSLEYLSNLHSKHEEWLRPRGTTTMRPEDIALLSDPSRNLVGSRSAFRTSLLRGSASHPCTVQTMPEIIVRQPSRVGSLVACRRWRGRACMCPTAARTTTPPRPSRRACAAR